MAHPEKISLNFHPKNLCFMCNNCCHVIALEMPQNELSALVENGDVFAKEFSEIFIPYKSVEDARKIDAKTVDDILLQLGNDNNFSENLTFYHCKYLRSDNSCEKQENRVSACKNYSVFHCAVMPSGCGFAGMLFLKREEEKQHVRKAKEELLDLAVLKTKIKNKETLERIASVEKKLNKTIELYREYGAADW